MESRFKMTAAYAAAGLHVTRIYGLGSDGKTCTCRLGADCRSPGKHPVDWAWQRTATTDEEKIAEWWDGSDPEPNVGVVLGEKSGVIDVEWDTDEGKETAVRYGLTSIDTPTYTSSRSEHRLFLYDRRMPQQGVYKIGGLEVRIGGGDRGAQSVFPPSQHVSGVQYRWKDGMAVWECPVAPLPAGFLDAITGGAARAEPREPARAILHRKAGEGERHRMLLKMAARLCVKMEDVHDPVEQQEVLIMLRSINSTQCNPPKTPEEVEAIWRSELRWAIKVRAADRDRREALEARLSGKDEEEEAAKEAEASSMLSTPFSLTGLEYRAGEWWPGSWKLTVVHSHPVSYTLSIPPFGDGVDATVDVPLDVETYRSAAKVAAAVLSATHTVILDEVPEDWALVWNGRGKRKSSPAIRGLKAKLMDVAIQKEATAENMRYAMVAEWFLGSLTTSPKPDTSDDSDGEPDCHGAPAWVRGRDGVWELWFSWNRVWEAVDRGRRKLEDGDRLDLKKRLLGITGESRLPYGRHTAEGGSKRRYIRFTDKHLQALEQLASGETATYARRKLDMVPPPELGVVSLKDGTEEEKSLT
jgi:hypothetical protein